MAQSDAPLTLHATCVAVDGKGLLIRGASGSGKSALALQLMAYGADLVSDDQVQLAQQGRQLIVSAPPTLTGLIEARGIGLLHATPVGPVAVSALVDLDALETDRLPTHSYQNILGVAVPVFKRVEQAYFAAALLQYLRSGALNPDADI